MTNKAAWDSLSSPTNSMEPIGSCAPSASESDIYRSVQAVLRELESQHPSSVLNKGMLRWTLHKKVRNNPANSLILVRVVVKELEKAERVDCRIHIIPLLHTLIYAVIQSAYLPDDLYKRVYDFCKRLLTLPQPYCTVGLSYTRRMKTERYTPGVLYQRMVVAEQSLKNVYHPFQERVFVFADPAVFSGPLGGALRWDIEASGSGGYLNPLDYMRSVVQHSIQAALGGELCHSHKLAQVLKEMGQDVEPYFQEVVASLEQSVEEGSKGEGVMLRGRLRQLYREILTHTDTSDILSSGGGGSLCDTPLPNPEMSFHLWQEDEEIWRELAKCVRSSSMSSEHFCLDQETDFDLADLPADLTSSSAMPRHSVMSTDSGIERDLPPGVEPSVVEPSGGLEEGEARLTRRGGIKMRPSVTDNMALMQDALEESGSVAGGGGAIGGGKLQRKAGCSGTPSFSKQQKHFTARIVVMGDDRVLGKLAKAFYFLRKREARRLFLTMKVNFQFYYIPVCEDTSPTCPVKENLSPSRDNPCALGSYLGMVDPWYDCNINSLGSMIPKLAKMQSKSSKQAEPNPFLSDVISYYVRTGLQPVYFTIYSVKISFSNLTKDPVEDVFLSHLELDFPEFKQSPATLKAMTIKQKKNTGDVCGAVVSVNYTKVSLSGRDVDKGMSVRTSGAQISAIPSNETEDLNCLTVAFNETKPKNTMEAKIRTCNIKIRTLEMKTFTVTLDKDSRRTFKDVQSIEITPCLDPGYCVQKTMRSKFSLGEEERDAGLSKYMNKGLPLPINTFAGIIN
ncbi:phosphoinositide 3-kinase regulatory subunit 6-like [Coregonus clupeaformis]|uniref:phosphoinositide 3-kinase regulatory subunit 6-like n=1 Tax=Coregonus clupeaformis TaxID=59861 RepID=UPI001E1C9B5B|nr:phosphoinositide 3-kinase regulatory subunit 6-like [Coregonus clupeaformis]